MRMATILLAVAGLGSAASVLAQAGVAPQPMTANGAAVAGAKPGALDGKALFHEKCAMCHGVGGMGTGLLARRVDPKVAELEKRDDLTPDYVITAARTGIGNMPTIARGEVSDKQMAAIAAYLAKGKTP
jgi:mono/diheme cytochrome c family protein